MCLYKHRSAITLTILTEKTLRTTRKMVFKVRALMDQLTVYKASYKPLPFAKARLRCQPPLKQASRIPYEMVTVYNDSYRVSDYALKPIKLRAPQDHNFLVATGEDRFHTTYESEYPVKDAKPGNYIYT